jgi:hypothetical protein
MTARSLLLLAIPFSLGACSSDSFATPDDGGATDAPAADTSADTLSDVVTPPPDASGVDGQAFDAGWKPPPPLVCANAPADAIFCADFDESADVAQGWTATFAPSGSVTSDTSVFYSPGRSAKTVANAGFPTYGQLYKNYIDSLVLHTHFALSFAFRIASTDNAATVEVAHLEYPAASGPVGNVRFNVVVGPGPAVKLVLTQPAGDAGSAATEYNLGSYQTATWHHLALDLKVTGAVKVDADLDGAKQSFSPGLPAADPSIKVRDIYVGARSVTTTSSPATINVDDVLYRAY